MKTVFLALLSGGFLASGLLNVIRQIRNTGALVEFLRFISLAKTEIRYRNAELNEIYSKALKQNYKYLSFFYDEIYINSRLDTALTEEFMDFIKKIGTTDEVGQMALCDEYKNRFEEALNHKKTQEKEKMQVNTALSVFGALMVLIFFL